MSAVCNSQSPPHGSGGWEQEDHGRLFQEEGIG